MKWLMAVLQSCLHLHFLLTYPSGNPLLLERTSNAVNVIKGLFHEFDQSRDGFVDCEEFKVGLQMRLVL